MNAWNEQTIRAAAAWQAFKRGRELWQAGAVSQAAAGAGGWKGVVAEGGKPRRVNVVFRSASDITTACGCPDNRATGALCAHGVAVGLAALAPAEKPKPQPATARAGPPVIARRVKLLGDWMAALARGRLSAGLEPSPREESSPADEALHRWLVGCGAAQTDRLLLDDTDVGNFLIALVDHPRVVTAAGPLAVADGGRLRLSAEKSGEEVILKRPGEDRVVLLGRSLWRIGKDEIQRMGNRALPESYIGIATGGIARINIKHLLETLTQWQEWFSFPEDGWLATLVFLPAEFTVQLELSGTLDRLEAVMRVEYPGAPAQPPGQGHIATLPETEGGICRVRDLAGERQAVARLLAYGWEMATSADGRLTLTGEDRGIPFLCDQAPHLAEAGWMIHEHPALAKRRAALAKVSPVIQWGAEIDNKFSFNLKFQTTDGNEFSIGEIRQMLRSGHATRKSWKGRQVVFDSDVGEVVELLSDLNATQESGRFFADFRTASVLRGIREKDFNTQKDSEQDSCFSTPKAVHAELRKYQKEGWRWIVDRWQKFDGALLADDMGLGKTVQSITALEQLLESNDGIVLVVTPVSLLENWADEWEKFAPGRKVRILRGAGREREKAEVRNGEAMVTSFGTLARDLAWHLGREYLAVVVDEASLMRNPDTDHAKALCKLKARKRLALTGTPLENGVRDLWSIFRFIQPGWLGGREEFRERYEIPLREGAATPVLARLRWRTAPFILRRTKEQVAADLPAKWVIDEFCPLSADQETVYRKLSEEGRRQVQDLTTAGQGGAARMRILTALLRLRQTCCDLALLGNETLMDLPVARRSGKMERLLEITDGAISGGRRILVFSQFQKQLVEIGKELEACHIAHLRLDGGTRNRAELVARFQSPDGPPVFLISLKAGGYGLNLTAADVVIHFDPWWNPAAEAQATDRAHRIGQTKPVTVYRLLTRGTVEEKVVRRQNVKRDLAAAIDESGGGDPDWSLDELKAMF